MLLPADLHQLCCPCSSPAAAAAAMTSAASCMCREYGSKEALLCCVLSCTCAVSTATSARVVDGQDMYNTHIMRHRHNRVHACSWFRHHRLLQQTSAMAAPCLATHKLDRSSCSISTCLSKMSNSGSASLGRLLVSSTLSFTGVGWSLESLGCCASDSSCTAWT